MKTRATKFFQDYFKLADEDVQSCMYDDTIDCLVKFAESEQQQMIKLLDRAEMLVGNPATNISSSTDLACKSWQEDYLEWKSLNYAQSINK